MAKNKKKIDRSEFYRKYFPDHINHGSCIFCGKDIYLSKGEKKYFLFYPINRFEQKVCNLMVHKECLINARNYFNSFLSEEWAIRNNILLKKYGVEENER